MTLNFIKENFHINGTEGVKAPFTFFERGFRLGSGGSPVPVWQDIIISGNTALTLVNAKADGLNYLKLYGKTIQESVTLPTGYTRLEYLQSNGNQYINTSFRALQRRALQIDFQYLTTPSTTSYVGGEIMKGSGTSLTSMMTIGVYGSNKIVVRFSDNAVNTDVDCGTTRHVVKVEEGKWTVDGVEGTFTPTGTISSSAYNIYLFGANRVNALFGSDPVRIFNAKVWDTGELRQDWYPCRRDSDGTLGMYDIVNDTFRTNAGTGTFTAGADYAPNTTEAEHIKLNYIRATGTQYINTGYTPVIGDEISIKYRFTTVASDDSAFYCLLSAGASSNVNDYQLIMIEGKSTSIPAGGFFYKYFANGSATTLSFSPVANTWYTANITSNGTLTTGGVSATSTPAGEISGDDKNLYLFIRANMASPFLGDIAELTITNNNVTKLHLIPVKRKVDSAICMYDTVTGTYIYNAGTGTFESGGSALTDVARIICNNGELKYGQNDNNLFNAQVVLGGTIKDTYSNGTSNNKRARLEYTYLNAGTYTLYNSGIVDQAILVSYSNSSGSGGQVIKEWAWGDLPFTFTLSSGRYIRAMVRNSSDTVLTSENIGDFSIYGIYADGDIETVISSSTPVSLDNVGFTDNYYIQSNGNPKSNEGMCYSDLIPVEANSTYYYIATTTDTSRGRRIHAYDSNGDWIEQLATFNPASATYTRRISTGATTAYIRVSTAMAETNRQLQLVYIATAENLLSVGTYKDVQEVITGNITRNVAVKVFDGTENWSALTSSRGYYTALTGIAGATYSAGGYCTHFNFVSWSNQNNAMANNSFGYNKNSGSSVANGNVTFKPDLTVYDSVTAWKNYLTAQFNAGTPVIIVFPLGTATTETVTGQTMSISEGTNVIEITQASIDGLPLEVSYKAGVTVTVTEIENANLDDSVTVTIEGENNG